MSTGPAPVAKTPPLQWVLLVLCFAGQAWQFYQTTIAPTPAAAEADFVALGKQVILARAKAESAAYSDASGRIAKGDKFADVMTDTSKALDSARSKSFLPVAAALSKILPAGAEPNEAQRAEVAAALSDYAKGVAR